MKTKMKQLMKSVIVAVISAVALAACGADNNNVPKAYQGSFQDQSGARLDLTGSEAQLQLDGKTLKGPVAPIDYNKLLQGQAGFYIYQENKDDKLLDVYWVTPDASTKREEGGIVYYTTDIVYMQLDLNQKEQVPSVTIVHADKGTVMIDTSTKQWQAGWPPRATQTTLVRTAAQAPKLN